MQKKKVSPKRKARSKPRAGRPYAEPLWLVEGFDELGPTKRKLEMIGYADGSIGWHAETLHPGMKEPYEGREIWAAPFCNLFLQCYARLAYSPKDGL
jgi:hypothetical protein